MERPLLSLLLGLALVSGSGNCSAAAGDVELVLDESIDIQVEETPKADDPGSVPEKISKKPVPAPAKAPGEAVKAAAGAPAPVAEEATAIELETEPVVEPEIERRTQLAEPTEPPPKGFDEFMKCGIALGQIPVTFDSQILGKADGIGTSAVNGQEVVVEGIHPEGTKFGVYRASPGSCSAYFLGIVEMRGPMDEMSCRGVVSKSQEPIGPGDVLYAYAQLRADFDRQLQMEGDEKSIKTTVRCVPVKRHWLGESRGVIQLSAGMNSGVLYGQYFQVSIPGYSGKKTHGRVIRVDKEYCFLKIVKIYQPVQTGDEMESVSRPGGPPPTNSR